MPPSMPHPDELLAGYVDGSATPGERRIVEEHLAGCATCQEEVELAGAARAALVALPELGAPGLAEAGVASLRRAAFHTVSDPDQAGAAGHWTRTDRIRRRRGDHPLVRDWRHRHWQRLLGRGRRG